MFACNMAVGSLVAAAFVEEIESTICLATKKEQGKLNVHATLHIWLASTIRKERNLEACLVQSLKRFKFGPITNLTKR